MPRLLAVRSWCSGLLLRVLVLLLLGLAPALATERRVALVIGNGAYAHATPLSNPGNDARLLATTLERMGFDLGPGPLFDLDQQGLRAALRVFRARAQGAAVAAIYYSGHGMELAGQNYLIPVDAELAHEKDAPFEAVPLETVVAAVEGASRLGLVMLDACRNNPFGKSKSSGGDGFKNWERDGAASQMAVSYAARAGSTAANGSGQTSPYAEALAQYLPTRGRDFVRVFGSVAEAVRSSTRGRQQPWLYFNPGPEEIALIPEEAAPPASGLQDREAWDLAQKLDTAAAYQAYLKTQCPSGTYCDFAAAALEKTQAASVVALPPAALEQSAQPAVPPPVSVPEQVEAGLGLGRADWRTAQQGLTALGFDPGGQDGVPGRRTREALAAWQRSTGHEASGHLTAEQREVLTHAAQTAVAALPAPVRLPERAPVTECDRLVEPQGVAERMPVHGLSWRAPSGAVPACRAAVERWPDEPRFALLYGVALYAESKPFKAIPWIRKAAEAGDTRGMTILGYMYNLGEGVMPDEAEAVRWYKKAAEAGNVQGISNLGNMYQLGRGGLAQDDAEAARWYLKAAALGHKLAEQRLNYLRK